MSTTLGNIAYAILMAGSLMTSCSEKPLTPEKAAAIRIAAGGERLPASASNIWFREVHRKGAMQNVRFDGPLDETRQFAEGLLKKELRVDKTPLAQYCCQDLDWWIKSAPPGAFVGNSDINGRSVQAVMTVESSGRARLWVKIFVKA
ncbi:MAG: hypothetical protein WC729_05620 [Sphingomonas sp.]|jgi:hypothetical protein|uniref:hypothetical protein n=1 Tax=Sphingomonas sp. TaxID=28214 RepID=UPI003562AA3F